MHSFIVVIFRKILTVSLIRTSALFTCLSRLSVTMPSAKNNALGYGAFLGLYANLRYQLLCGFDRTMVNYFDVIGVGLFFTTALRFVLYNILA